jgi:Bacterial protein of unknown function (DUF899)
MVAHPAGSLYSTFGRGIEEFHNGYHYLDLTALGRQEEWEEPKGRATPLGLQVGGPAMRHPDEYETQRRPARAGQASAASLACHTAEQIISSTSVRTSHRRVDNVRAVALAEVVGARCCPTGDRVADGVGDALFVDGEVRLARDIRKGVGQALG